MSKLRDKLDSISMDIIETFYTEYDNWCRNMWDSEFYVKWLKKDEFFETIKTYNDWDKLQKDVGLIDDNVSKKQTKMSDYIKGQEDLIKYIKQQLLLMANNSPDETIMEDVVNFLQNLKPKEDE